jgi:hypothetical protein
MRRVTDLALRILRQAVGHETLQGLARRVDDAEGRVARAGHAGCGFHDPHEDTVERELGGDRDPGLDECPQASGLVGGGHQGMFAFRRARRV